MGEGFASGLVIATAGPFLKLALPLPSGAKGSKGFPRGPINMKSVVQALGAQPSCLQDELSGPRSRTTQVREFRSDRALAARPGVQRKRLPR